MNGVKASRSNFKYINEMNHLLKILSPILCIGLLASCYQESPDEGRLSLGITDAPIDGVSSLVLTIHSIGIKPINQDPIVIPLPKPRSIDLLQLQGDKFEELVYQEPVPAGRYNWVRLYTDATQSYLIKEGLREDLIIRTNQDGGVDVAAALDILPGGQVFAIIDIDLRTSLKAPTQEVPSHYLDTDMRLIEIDDAGHISGKLTSTAINHLGCTSDYIAVYLYEGSGVTPDDYDGLSPDQDRDERGPDPFTSALVFLNTSKSSGTYSFGFLPQGGYTIAYTCNANFDAVDKEDASVKFLGATDVTVFKGKTTTYDFK